MSKRLNPRVRKESILAAAAVVAVRERTIHITRTDVAKVAGVADATLNSHFTTMHQLRVAVVKAALRSGDVPVLAVAMVSDKYRPEGVPVELREAVAAHVAGGILRD